MADEEHQLVPLDGGVAERRPLLGDVQDVIGEEILPRLPAKSLLRFRCVCKSWRDLISGSLFANKHLRRAVVTSRLQILEYEPDNPLADEFARGRYELANPLVDASKRERYLKGARGKQHDDVPRWCSVDVHSVNLAQPTGTIHILGSYNGLICLQVSKGFFLLWNPCTRETKMLPQLDTRESMFHHIYGFGYDSAGEDYKVVYGRHILSVKTGSWMELEGCDEQVLFSPLEGTTGCLFNGALHWLGFKPEGGAYSVEIISFDLAAEEFQAVLRLPSSFQKTYRTYWSCDGLGIGMGTSKTGLFVYHYDQTNAFTVWTRKENYKSKKCWTKVLKIPFGMFMRDDRLVFGDYKVSYITILESGAVLICCNHKKVVLYRPAKKICTTVYDFETQKFGYPGTRAGHFTAIMCLETLVSPKSCFSSSPSV